MAEHTSGQWSWDTQRDGLRCYVRCGDVTIADVFPPWGPGRDMTYPTLGAERDANARLMAASPVMLEALQAAYDALAFCDQGVLARKIVRRAIDMAAGEQE